MAVFCLVVNEKMRNFRKIRNKKNFAKNVKISRKKQNSTSFLRHELLQLWFSQNLASFSHFFVEKIFAKKCKSLCNTNENFRIFSLKFSVAGNPSCQVY